MKYLELCQKIENKECRFLWTEKEFNEKFKTSKTNIDIISKCGHNTTVQCSNFLYCNTGTICKNCNYKSQSDNRRNVENNTLLKEYNVIKALQNYLNDDIEIKLTNECCLADMAIKPKNNDLWLPIQVKTCTKVSHGIYSFNINRQYKNMLILLFAIEDQKLWILDGNSVNINKINIGKNTSIYSKNEIKKEDLKNSLSSLYEKYKNYLITFDEINIQLSKNVITSFEFYKYREEQFKNLNFSYPEIAGSSYDCIINDRYKIQDKVSTLSIKKKGNNIYNYFVVNLCRCRKYNYISYKLGDNDFYWIHLPNKDGAYIIPESILYENKIIFENNKEVKNNFITLYPHYTREKLVYSKIKSAYLNDYLYFYNNPEDIERIENLFSSLEREPIINEYICPITIT